MEKTVKDLELEFKQLKGMLRRLEKSIARGKNRSFAEIEMLCELLPFLRLQIDYNLRRTEEMRLQSSIKTSEKADHAIGLILQRIGAGVDADNRSGSSLIRAWTESLKRNCESRRDEQEAILNSICNSAATYREILENLKLQHNPTLTRYLPSVPTTDGKSSKKEHKGRPPSDWTLALDACVRTQGRNITWKEAATWLGLNHFLAAKEFIGRFGDWPMGSDRTLLSKLLRSNEKALALFHKQWNAAKQRLDRKRD